MGTPVSPAITDTFSSLVFFYDPLNKKILFSNIPSPVFFGYAVDMEAEVPFLPVAGAVNNSDLRRDWQTCLTLSEQQSHYFWFHKKISEEAGVIFHFHAVGMRMAPENFSGDAPGSSPGILFSVEKTPAGNVAAWMLESERLRKTLERYKEDHAEFIDIAAHNLDAPLRKLGVLIERVTGVPGSTGKDEQTENYMQRIRSCLGDMRSLIDNLAILSRVTSGGLKPVTCAIETIVQEEWQNLRHEVNEKKAVLSTGSLPELEGDTAQYRQLFRQILSNSLRFSKNGEPPAIRIHSSVVNDKEKQAHGLAQDTDYFKIEISDNGIGFKPEYAEKIFRPFLRLHGKSEYPGNGIGLALCKRIVENHRGVIYAEADESEGARFVLLLPQILN